MALQRVTLKDQIKQELLRRILSGAYKPGERLIEMKIAEEMGTSQAPVREALRELQNMRLIEFFPHRGTRVRQPSAAEISEIFAVRSVLEELATRLATGRSMPTGPLRDCHQGMLGAAKRDDLEGLIHESARFHRLIVEGSGNQILFETWTSLHIEAHTLIGLLRTDIDYEAVADSHLPILHAIERGDSDAAGVAARDHQEFFAQHQGTGQKPG